MAAIDLTSGLSYVDTLCDTIMQRILSYATIYTTHMWFDLNSYISYVDTSCSSIIRRLSAYDSILASAIKLSTKSDACNT